MMMWEKLKLVAVGALVAVGLTAQALSQQAPKGRDPRLAAAPGRGAISRKAERKDAAIADGSGACPAARLIEVVGISPHPSGPDTWWRPDGTPLHPATVRPVRHGKSRTTTPSFGRLSCAWSTFRTEPTTTGGSTRPAADRDGPARRDGKPVPGLSEAVARFPADASTCTILFKVAAGPWKYRPDLGEESGRSWPRTDASFIFGDAIATKKGTTLSVTHNIQNMAVRLVAVDDDGKEHPAEVRSGSGVKDFQQIVVEFDLPPEQIKEFRVQTRPYEEVEIPGIALKRK